MGASESTAHSKDFKALRELQDVRFGDCVLFENPKTGAQVLQIRNRLQHAVNLRPGWDDLKARKVLEHENILKVHAFTQAAAQDFCSDEEFASFYTEFSARTLQHEIQERIKLNRPIEESNLWAVLWQTLSALSHLQKHGLSHGDLCPRAIFFCDTREQTLGANGSNATSNNRSSNTANGSRSSSSPEKHANSLPVPVMGAPYVVAKIAPHSVVTNGRTALKDAVVRPATAERGYLAPELIEKVKKKDSRVMEEVFKADVFSLGLTFLEAATFISGRAYYNWGIFALDEKLLETNLEKTKLVYSRLFAAVLAKMLRLKPEERGDPAGILNVLAPHMGSLTRGENSTYSQRDLFTYFSDLQSNTTYQTQQLQPQPQPHHVVHNSNGVTGPIIVPHPERSRYVTPQKRASFSKTQPPSAQGSPPQSSALNSALPQYSPTPQRVNYNAPFSQPTTIQVNPASQAPPSSQYYPPPPPPASSAPNYNNNNNSNNSNPPIQSSPQPQTSHPTQAVPTEPHVHPLYPNSLFQPQYFNHMLHHSDPNNQPPPQPQTQHQPPTQPQTPPPPQPTSNYNNNSNYPAAPAGSSSTRPATPERKIPITNDSNSRSRVSSAFATPSRSNTERSSPEPHSWQSALERQNRYIPRYTTANNSRRSSLRGSFQILDPDEMPRDNRDSMGSYRGIGMTGTSPFKPNDSGPIHNATTKSSNLAYAVPPYAPGTIARVNYGEDSHNSASRNSSPFMKRYR